MGPLNPPMDRSETVNESKTLASPYPLLDVVFILIIGQFSDRADKAANAAIEASVH